LRVVRQSAIAVGVCLVVLGAAWCPASPILSFIAPQGYVPGQTFELEVTLGGAMDLSLFNVELELAADEGAPGVDYWFAGALKPLAGYVFDGQDAVGFEGIVLTQAKHRITLSDLLVSESVDTLQGVNDGLARVTIATSGAMTVPIRIACVPDSLELDRPVGQPIEGCDVLAASLPTAEVPVPEPLSAWVWLASIAAVLRGRRRRGRDQLAAD